jgi:beta-glucanase (GH16 family)
MDADFMKMFCSKIVIPILCLFLCTFSTKANDTAPMPLLDLNHTNPIDQIRPAGNDIAVKIDQGAIDVVVTPGTSAWPGITIMPPTSQGWDLSEHGHIQAQITNTGSQQITVCMRVDNPHDWDKGAWNTECVKIEPGKTVNHKVIFGHNGGYREGYPLKPEKVIAVLFFTNKVTEPISYQIRALQADGPAGELSPQRMASMRTRPKNGILLGQGVTLDTDKQLQLSSGTTAQSDGDALHITASAGTPQNTITLKPKVGFWHLGDGTALQITIKNEGQTAVTPTIDLGGEWNQFYNKTQFDPIAPGDEKQLTVAFAATTPWQGVPAAQRKNNHDTMPNTGTGYASDKTVGVRMNFTHQGALDINVTSVKVTSGIAVLPDWLGKRPPVEGDWVQTFNDDFDGDALNQTLWRNEGPNYWDKTSRWSKDNLIVKDGKAQMRYEKKAGFQNDNPKDFRKEYTSAYMDTFNKWAQKYGYFECRMKLTHTVGLWPAFWLMPDRGQEFVLPNGSNSKRCTTSDGGMEFDIMEHLGIWGPHRFNIAMHWDDYGPNHKALGTGNIYVDYDKDGYITSGLLWLPGLAVFYCNGIEIGRWKDPRVCNVPAYMMFTLPAGGWDGNYLDDAGLPDSFFIDYVRVWQRKDLMDASAKQ